MLEREGNLVAYGIPDSSTEVLLVRDGDRVWRMSSCVDMFEENPRLMATPQGVGARDSLPTPAAGDTEERRLREFREAWKSAKELLLATGSETGADLDLASFEFAAIGSSPR
jgi:hypothetical protein